MKKKHSHILEKIKSEYEAELLAAKLKLEKEIEKWEEKLHNLDIDLTTAKDRVLIERMKRQQAIHEQVDETKCALARVKHYADSLEETNDDFKIELKAAIIEKHTVFGFTNKARWLAAERLEMRHQERTMQRTAEDKLARQLKSATQMDQIIEEYRLEIDLSKKSKRHLRKEWANDETAIAHGGGRQWPPWVVQVICELLVNSTSPQLCHKQC